MTYVYTYILIYIYIYTYNWFVLLYGRNQHNIVKPLSSNQKKIFKLKKCGMKYMMKLEMSLIKFVCGCACVLPRQ